MAIAPPIVLNLMLQIYDVLIYGGGAKILKIFFAYIYRRIKKGKKKFAFRFFL